MASSSASTATEFEIEDGFPPLPPEDAKEEAAVEEEEPASAPEAQAEAGPR